MEKKKVYLIAIAAVIVIGIVLLIVFLINDNNNYKAEPVLPSTPADEPQMSDEEFIKTEEGRNLSSILATYGYEIYTNQNYLSFAKTTSGVYYATITDLANLSYDTSMIDKNCKADEAIIFFDPENKMNNDYKEMPVTFRISCQPLQNNR